MKSVGVEEAWANRIDCHVVANQVADKPASGTATIAPLTVVANSNAGSFTINIPSPSYTIVATDAAKLEGDSGTTDYTFTVSRGGDTTIAGSVNKGLLIW